MSGTRYTVGKISLTLYSLVKPIRLGRTSISYIFGASIKTRFEEWKDDPSTHRGIPSTLREIVPPEITKGTENGEEYQEVVVPEDFAPGSIMVFATQMSVSELAIFSALGG